MKRLALFLTSALLLLGSEDNYSTRVAVKAESAQLSDGYDPWSSRQLRVDFSRQKQFGIGIAGEELERYGRMDQREELSAWFSLPLDMTYSGFLTQAENGEIIPKTTVSNRLAVNVLNSWQLAAEKTENRYHGGNRNDVLAGELITYVDRYRLSYTHYHTDVKNAGNAQSDKLTFHAFYLSGFTALLLSKGKELEALPHDRVLVQDVSAFALFGEYKIDSRWALTYSYEYVEQGALYLRNGVGFGLACTL